MPALRDRATRVVDPRAQPGPLAREATSLHHYHEVLAGLAHDLKNPLTRIRARAQLLQRHVGQAEQLDRVQLSEGLAQIEAASTRMAMLLDEVVDLSAAAAENGHAPPLMRKPVDLARVARYSAEQYEQTSDRHRILVHAPQREVVGHWDPIRVERVVSNLLSNAVKYSPGGGDVLVSVWDEADPRDGTRWAVLRVRDEGMGIAAEDLPYVFEPLYRGGNAFGWVSGTGLGLAAARQMVAEHGGTIQVESEERNGSTFTVRLPIDPPGPRGEVP